MADVSGFIDYLDANYDTSEVAGGSNVKVNGQCPFCGEDRIDLRMYVNAKTGLGICFHCSTAFGPYKFIMAAEKCSLGKAKAIAGGDPDGWVRTQEEAPADPSLVWPVSTDVEKSEVALQYLQERNISAEAVRHFMLNFCKHRTPIGDRVFNTQNRIIIPIHDIDGKPISWIGRSIVGAKPKYLFPPAFKGADTLFNAWAIPQHAPYLIICEGVMDVFGWWQHGAKNVVATFGKKISANQIEIIKALAPKVLFIAWDQDAMWENYSFIEKYGHLFDIRVIDLKGKDADECTGRELTVALEACKGYSWEQKILHALH